MRILGIETSCDETGVALMENEALVTGRVATQEVHSKWGGVVPELASRLHLRTLSTMVNDVFSDAGWSFSSLDAVAATRGPGLIGALLVGVSYAKGLAVSLGGIPYVGVNHLEAHLWAAEISGRKLKVPCLALLISGGHTELVRIDGFRSYTFLGGTLDDAAGEVFDKVGGMLGIAYPAGPELSKMAEPGDPNAIHLPVAETRNPLDFSFSGLKTAVLRRIEQAENPKDKSWKQDLAASFQYAVKEQIARRLRIALGDNSYRSLLIAGGVAANLALRETVREIAVEHGTELIVPPVELCTDNGVMIAYLAVKQLKAIGPSPLDEEADPNLVLVKDVR